MTEEVECRWTDSLRQGLDWLFFFSKYILACNSGKSTGMNNTIAASVWGFGIAHDGSVLHCHD